MRLPYGTQDRSGRNWFARIISRPDTLNLLMDIWHEKGGEYYVVKPMKIEFTRLKDNNRLQEASLEIPWEYQEAFLQALAIALEERSITGVTDSQLKGKLEAMKDHLKDMRDLVFKRGDKDHD